MDRQFKKQIQFLIVLLGTSFILTTSLFWISEKGTGDIQQIEDAIWWWIVTSSTVGYGDLVPVSLPGRIAGVVTIIVGIFGYTHAISMILQFVTHKFEKQERGKGEVNYKNHVVICEYTAYSDELIQEIKARNIFRNKKIVIVGSLVNRTPYPEYDFIYGVPISPQVHKRANIVEASTIFVFSNNRFEDPDEKTLHMVSRIMQLNNHAKIIVELNDEYNELLNELPRKVTVMKTSDLLRNALSHNYIDVKKYLDEA